MSLNNSLREIGSKGRETLKCEIRGGIFLKDGTDEHFRVDREESGERKSPKVQKRRNNG